MASERPGLVRRVALASAAAAAMGGALAAIVAGAVAARLVSDHEDEVVLAVARELADEVMEELGEDEEVDEGIAFDAAGRPVLGSVLAHELSEVKQPGAVAAILAGDSVMAGDLDLPRVAHGECVTHGHGGTARRVCGAMLDGDQILLLGVSAARERERFTLVAWALVIGAVVGAGIGGVLSHRAASWALVPVTDLRDRVRRIDPVAPRSKLLDPPAAYAEVEDLRRAVADLVERLGASLSHAQSFSAQAAHELRTPLALLAGELELMVEGEGRTAADAQALQRLRGVVAGLITLAQRLLVLAGAGRLPAERGEPVDLSDVVEAVRASLSSESEARLVVRVADDVVVRGDFDLLRSLVHNAVENALKFSSGPVEVTVQTSEGAVIEVSDRGAGVPTADRDRVFAPFIRGVDASALHAPGHGIGLALIARVAEAHGGSAKFVDVAAGARLRVTIPSWPGPATPTTD